MWHNIYHNSSLLRGKIYKKTEGHWVSNFNPPRILIVEEDKLLFKEMLPDLEKLTQMSNSRITYIFDAGKFCKYNAEILEDKKIDFITTLRPSDHKDLLEIQMNKNKFKPINNKEGVWVYRTKKKIYSRELTVLVLFSKEYFENELKTYLTQKNRAMKKLKDLKARLEKTLLLKNNPSSQKRIYNKRIRQYFISCVYLKNCFHIEIITKDSYPQLQFTYKKKAFQSFINLYCGKELIATSRDDLPSERIIEAKYHQSYIENAFKISKNHSLGGFWPIYHWLNEVFRKISAFLNARSASLFVGSTPSSYRNIQRAYQFLYRLFQKRHWQPLDRSAKERDDEEEKK